MIAYKFAASMMLLAVGVCCQDKQWQPSNEHRRYFNTHSPNSYGVSRQFAHFAGPVSGAEHQVLVPRASVHAHTRYNQGAPAGMSVDYVAKPDYKFGFGVEDSKTGNKQAHTESRDGDVVRGEYSLLDADGTMRIVQYTADPRNGFQAVVKRAGHAPEVFGAPAAPKQPKQQSSTYNKDDDDDDDEDY